VAPAPSQTLGLHRHYANRERHASAHHHTKKQLVELESSTAIGYAKAFDERSSFLPFRTRDVGQGQTIRVN